MGSLFALATVYAERLVGFWLAYLLPGLVYMAVPVVLLSFSRQIYKAPPQGSIFIEALAVLRICCKGGIRGGKQAFWNQAKPSFIQARDGAVDLNVIFWDDKFVEEIQQAIGACAIFFLTPVFHLADGGVGNSYNNMSAAMVLNGIPNDLFNNFNALSILIFTPIITYELYPLFAKMGYPLQPMTRMAIGTALGA